MRHLVIPDTQCKPGAPLDHLRWAGLYILDKKPERIIHLGDNWDFPSLSSFDKGKKAMEGRRFVEDIKAGNEGIRLLDRPTEKANWAKRNRSGKPEYAPEKWLLRGNHENRMVRATEADASLDGLLTDDLMVSEGWTVVPFLEVLELDGIRYSHYFYNPMTGKPYGGQNVDTRLKTIGCTFTMGHQQGLKYGLRDTIAGMQHGLVVGSFYLHDEDYLGPQGNANWRGLVLCNQVREGTYDPVFISMAYLCERYEGVTLSEFLQEKYPDQTGSLWR